MRRLAVGLLIVVAAAGCGGSKKPDTVPENAYLTAVQVKGSSVRFEFKSRPQEVAASWQPASRVAECGSGAPVRLRGRAFAVVHFRPAASAEIKGEEVVLTYTGPKRLHGPGPVLDAARMCDFEADLGWAIGVQRRMPLHVERDGSTVTVSFG
jgi:hypothetical protein